MAAEISCHQNRARKEQVLTANITTPPEIGPAGNSKLPEDTGTELPVTIRFPAVEHCFPLLNMLFLLVSSEPDRLAQFATGFRR